MDGRSTHRDTIVIVGGGVAGLATAVQVARRRGTGLGVTLLESHHNIGGRAATGGSGGYRLNLGPHALYARGEGVLRALGVEVSGGIPSSGYSMELGGRLLPLPTGVLSLLASPAFGWRDKWALARLLRSARAPHHPALDHVSVDQWLRTSGLDGGLGDRGLGDEVVRNGVVGDRAVGDRAVGDGAVGDDRALGDGAVGNGVFTNGAVGNGAVGDFVRALVRLTSFANAPSLMSAGAALSQIRASLDGVRYLDGGWATIVDGLARVAESFGVTIRAASKVESLRIDERVRAVVLRGGEEVRCGSAVLTLSPETVVRLLGEAAPDALRTFAAEAPAARAACLDLALSSLPERHPSLFLGVDRPICYSIHTPSARLTPEDGAVIHVLRYLTPGERVDSAAARAELEELMDTLQPGWRDVLVEARWSPAMTVAHAIPEASRGGLRGRPDARCVGRGIALAGDWVGPRGMLVDAALFSAEDAARASVEEAARAAA